MYERTRFFGQLQFQANSVSKIFLIDTACRNAKSFKHFADLLQEGNSTLHIAVVLCARHDRRLEVITIGGLRFIHLSTEITSEKRPLKPCGGIKNASRNQEISL
jgi:hypothetical protein